jgi:TonB-linked SusC/RagA family outer membrane protein
MRKLLMLIFMFCGLVLAVNAQQKTVTGTVTGSDDGLAIIGATVQIKGTTTGVPTDLSGKYTIAVPQGAVLQIRYVGMRTQEITVGSENVYDVVLEPDFLRVDEVVVVAYGTTRKESFTGSAAVVRSDQLAKSPTTSVVKALQANATGVHVVTSNSASNAEPIIRIRGIGSITADANPLWVVDGIVGASVPNLNDVESVTVLKDAAAASLYGSRAANGVIVVTTKKGVQGKTRFTYLGKQSYSTRTTNKFEMLNASEFMQKSWEGLYNYAVDQSNANPAAYAHANLNLLAGKNPFNVAQPFDDNGNLVSGAKLMLDQSWFDLAFKTGVISEHNLTASGGDGNTKFYFSGSYVDQKAITVPDELQRFMGHINVTTQVNKKVSVGYTSTLRHQMGNTIKDITNGSGTGYTAYTYPNNVPLYQLDSNFQPEIGADGKPIWNWDNLVSKDYNSIAQNELDPRGSRSTNVFNSFNVNWKLLEGLVFDTKVSGRLYNYNDDSFRNPYHGDGKAYGGSSTKGSDDNRSYFTSTTLNYDKSFGSHNIGVLAGYETEYNISKSLTAYARGYDIPFSDEFSIAAEPFGTPVSSTVETSMISYFSRVNYTLSDKYYVSGSYRRDGSSRFGPNVRWADFWSASASWRVSQEDFLAGVSWLDDFKVRASYGTNGNQAVPAYAYLPTFALGNVYDGNIGMIHNRLPNYDLRWEKNKILNVGFDFGIFTKLRGSFEYFDRLSDDLLQNKPLPPSTGFTSILSNVGGLKNKGFEIELHSTNVESPNFVWLTDFNFTKFTNEITALSQEEIISGTKRWVVGNSLYTWYLREYAGVDPTNGRALWYKDILDTDGKPTGERETTNSYSAATRYELGQSVPDFYGSLTNSFIIMKDVNFSFQFYWSVGGKLYNSLRQQTMNDGSRYGHQLNKEVLDSWKAPGDETDVPRFVYNNGTQSNMESSRFLEDGSFVRMRNINLSYSLPRQLLGGTGLDAASVFINGDNLFVLTKYKGNDPEQGLSGLTNTTDIPNVRTVTFGINLSF